MIDNITLVKIIVLSVLGFSLWCGYKLSATTFLNIEQLGGNEEGKERVATRVTTNFWIGFAGVLIIISGLFNLITTELFVAFLTADLLSLGIKLTNDFIETRKHS